MRWEYRLIEIDHTSDNLQVELNDWGALGWEAVHVYIPDSARPWQLVFLFKRPVPIRDDDG